MKFTRYPVSDIHLIIVKSYFYEIITIKFLIKVY